METQAQHPPPPPNTWIIKLSQHVTSHSSSPFCFFWFRTSCMLGTERAVPDARFGEVCMSSYHCWSSLMFTAGQSVPRPTLLMNSFIVSSTAPQHELLWPHSWLEACNYWCYYFCCGVYFRLKSNFKYIRINQHPYLVKLVSAVNTANLLTKNSNGAKSVIIWSLVSLTKSSVKSIFPLLLRLQKLLRKISLFGWQTLLCLPTCCYWVVEHSSVVI